MQAGNAVFEFFVIRRYSHFDHIMITGMSMNIIYERP